MMNEIVLLKYGEVVMKGLNRGYFDCMIKRRVMNILSLLDGEFAVEYAQSTLFIRPVGKVDLKTVSEAMKKVFGVIAVCRGYECEKTVESISETVIANIDTLLGSAKTFKCAGKRSDKSFPLTSPELSAEIGGVVLDKRPDMKVDVNNPDVTVTLEIRDKCAVVHGGGEKGAGGMPVGSSGRGVLLLSGGIDSPVAGYMMAKRGISLDALYFESPPYTGENALKKVGSLAGKLSEYCGRIYLSAVPVTDIQAELQDKCEHRLFTILLRRFMTRIAALHAESIEAEALITGESVGQVASQTLPAIAVTDNTVNIPVLRPCVGLDKEEIVQIARSIGTLDISSQPYDDCCAMFTPKHPNIRPKLDEVIAEEAKLDVDSLVKAAYEARHVYKIRPGHEIY